MASCVGLMILYPMNCSQVILEKSMVTCACAGGPATSANRRPPAASMDFNIFPTSLFAEAPIDDLGNIFRLGICIDEKSGPIRDEIDKWTGSAIGTGRVFHV